MKTGAEVIYFTSVRPSEENVVVTVASNSQTLPGTDEVGVKASEIEEFPKKGRGTAGVRCQKFIRGQNQLIAGYVGPNFFQLMDSRGKRINLELELVKRDSSGVKSAPISFIGSY